MTTIEEIKYAVEHLSREDLIDFRAWFIEFEAQIWDEKIKKDIQAGKLNQLAQQAVKDLLANQCTEL
jgi:hypothetical protein